MKKRILILLSVLFGTSSCTTNIFEESIVGENSDVVTEEFDGGKVTYKYNAGVVIIDNSNSALLQKIEADTILYFSKAARQKFNLTEGTILTSRLVNDKIPYGLGNKVVTITEDGDNLCCVTTSARLDEIFEVLDLDAEIDLIPDTISQTLADANGNPVTVKSDKRQDITRATTIGSPEILTLEFTEIKDSASVQPYISGSLSFGVTATIDIDIDDDDYELSATVYQQMEGGVGVKKSFFKGEKKILPATGKWSIYKGVLVLGPLVLRPFLDADLGVKAEIEGSISTSISNTIEETYGIKNGEVFCDSVNKTDLNIVKNFEVNGKGEAGLVTHFYIGSGLYTDNTSFLLTPSLNAMFSADFRYGNENLFRFQPTLNFDFSASMGAEVKASFWKLFSSSKRIYLASIKLLSLEWPLLPKVVDNTLSVERRGIDDPLVFDASYELEGGLLIDLYKDKINDMKLYPAFIVYKGGEVIDTLRKTEPYSDSSAEEFEFELEGLEKDISYTGKPAIFLGDNLYESDGIPFSTASPTAAITDIVQTGSEKGSFYFNGYYYDYRFFFYINAYIKGSDQCSEWGLFAEDGIPQHVALENRDISIKVEFTGYSNNPYYTSTQQPYAILKSDGSTKYFEPHSRYMYYGGYNYTALGKESPSLLPDKEDPSQPSALQTNRYGNTAVELISIEYK